METVEDIVIVGAGIAGLTTALGLHRMGIKILVLESWDELRMTGFAFVNWTNAWKALDALGIGDILRQHHYQLKGVVTTSTVSGLPTSEMSFAAKGKQGDHEVRCVRRQALLETLANQLPSDTIRFSAKVVSIEEENHFKLVHLSDGSILKTKVLLGCDGVNSVVAQWLGLSKPAFSGRWSTRGIAEFPDGHNFEQKYQQFFGNGFRSGFLPCDENTMYWFFTFSPAAQHTDAGEEANQSEMKQFVLKNLGKVPVEILRVVEKTSLDNITSAPLRLRWPFNLLWPGAIYKGNVCAAGDALHPMTPDLGQGGCAALEDGIVLARCLSEVFLKKRPEEKVADEYSRIEKGIKKFAEERKWRSFKLIATAYMVGMIQQSDRKVISFLREKVLSSYLASLSLKIADFDCGKLLIS